MSDDTVPIAHLKRTLRLLLIVYGSCILTALLAGAALVAHVDPVSECLLYSYVKDGQLYYGEEAYCEVIGYLYLGCIVGAMVLFYLTLKHLRLISEYDKTGQLLRGNEALLKINKRNMMLHLGGCILVFLLTIALTSGYVSACNNLSENVSKGINDKKQVGEWKDTLQNRYETDNSFWRYNDEIQNTHGGFSVNENINCRVLFTDPQIHSRLRDNHNTKWGGYFGYHYKVDLSTYDPSSLAVTTNTLIEASLAGGWLSVLLWGGSFVFMMVQKFYIKKEKRDMDKVSLHSGMDGTLRKEDMSMISGYQPSFQRGGINGSNRSLRSMKSMASRRNDMDDMAFALAGVNTPTPRFTPTYPNGGTLNSSIGMPQQFNSLPMGGPVYPAGNGVQGYPDGQGYPGMPQGYPAGQQGYPAGQQGYPAGQQAYPAGLQQGFQYPVNAQNVYNPNGSLNSTPRTPRAFQRRQQNIPQISVEDTDKDHMETEIM